MKRYEIGDQKGVSSLRLVDAPEPVPADNQVVVRFKAHSLNYRDVMVLSGWYGPPKAPTTIPVSDGAGEVVAVAPGVSRVRTGDRVMVSFFTRWIDGPFGPQYFGSDLGGGADGTLAEMGVFPAEALVPIPKSLSYAEAACLPCAGVTAWNAIVEAGRAKGGDNVLLIGTGGVSIFGVQIARMIGATPVILSSSDAKLAKAQSLGAATGINTKATADWPKAVLETTGGTGADVVVETAGPGNLERSFAAAAFNGRVCLIGGFEQAKGPINTMMLVGKNLNLRGITVGSRSMLEALAKRIDEQGIKPAIDALVPFDAARDAYERMLTQQHVGKIVITH